MELQGGAVFARISLLVDGEQIIMMMMMMMMTVLRTLVCCGTRIGALPNWRDARRNDSSGLPMLFVSKAKEPRAAG